MPLDRSRLECVAIRGDVTFARCPACAEAGSDKTGNHLRITPDGRFGCAVHPGDRAHRARIWALAGDGGALPPGANAYQRPVVCPVAIRRWRPVSDASDGCLEVAAAKLCLSPQFSDGADASSKPLHTREKFHMEMGLVPTPSAPSELVPLDRPFQEGMRYREAGAVEVHNRLDLFVADPAGPWIRRHGVLIAVNPVPERPPLHFQP
jgi:hypothetical protein